VSAVLCVACGQRADKDAAQVCGVRQRRDEPPRTVFVCTRCIASPPPIEDPALAALVDLLAAAKRVALDRPAPTELPPLWRRRLFRNALKILDRQGWWRGPGPGEVLDGVTEHGPNGEVCIATAVKQACGGHLEALALDHLKGLLGLPLEEASLSDWNDDPARELAEVREALRMAAE
jgi:hypothetical protein